MMRLLSAVFALALAFPAHAQSAYETHWAIRDSMVAFERDQVGQGRTMLLGDSITESFYWVDVNGCFIVNAGYGGALIHTLALRAPMLAQLQRPKIVHVMAGTNDLLAGSSSIYWPSLAQDMATILNAFKSVGSKIVVWPVPPLAQSAAPADYAQNRATLNNLWANAATNAGVYWDWWFPTTMIGSNGYALSGSLNGDGVHFSATTQTSRWNRIETWRQHILANTGVQCQ